jgi:hypothetical protein
VRELGEAGIRSGGGRCLEGNGLDECDMTCFWLKLPSAFSFKV